MGFGFGPQLALNLDAFFSLFLVSKLTAQQLVLVSKCYEATQLILPLGNVSDNWPDPARNEPHLPRLTFEVRSTSPL